MARNKRITLIHNEKAGQGRPGRAELMELLSGAGYEVHYVAYKHCDLAAALDEPADLIAVAGGDGTVAKVATDARSDGPPLGILPLGTANNIAKSLGLDRPHDQLVASWSARRLRPFHLVEASGPWGTQRLAEGLGFGAFEQAVVDMPKHVDVAAARRLFAAALLSAAAEHVELYLDGESVAGPFALLEITTVPLVGPNLELAPAADPSNRKLAICWIPDGSDEREALSRWVAAPDATPAPVSLRAAERASIVGRFRRVRLNGHFWETKPDAEPASVELACAAEPLWLLVPD